LKAVEKTSGMFWIQRCHKTFFSSSLTARQNKLERLSLARFSAQYNICQ
jgi:hypothetical protein